VAGAVHCAHGGDTRDEPCRAARPPHWQMALREGGMRLTLHLTVRGQGGAASDLRTLEGRSLTIGRGRDSDWVLDDPHRVLSKTHCIVELVQGQHVLTDCSTNGTFLNGASERLDPGSPVPLRHGDRIQLGDYEILVDLPAEEPSFPTETDPIFGSPILPPATSGPAFFGDGPSRGPVDDPLFRPDPDDAGALGRETDPFRPPSFQETRLAKLPAVEPVPDDDPLFGRPRIDPWQAAARSDHVAAEGQFFRPPPVRQDIIPEDWDAEFRTGPESRPSIAPPPPPIRQESPPPATAPAAMAPAAEPAAIEPPAPALWQLPPAGVPATVAAGAAAARLIEAFARGAGLPPGSLGDAEAETLMRRAGAVLRAAVAGVRANLEARSAMKAAFRIERTTIRPHDNNPLKFADTPEESLTALLCAGDGAYGGDAAPLEEAFDDIRAHQMAVLAGMQAALGQLLARFDPEALEARLKDGAGLADILPTARKARYWQAYEALYRDIAREAEEDFRGLFGETFVTEYQAQIRAAKTRGPARRGS
jgi:type VI secretion system protein